MLNPKLVSKEIYELHSFLQSFFFFFKVGANTSKENFILLASDIIMRAEVQIFQLQMNEGNPSCLRSAPENTT